MYLYPKRNTKFNIIIAMLIKNESMYSICSKEYENR